MSKKDTKSTLIAILQKWMNRHFADEEAILLVLLILGGMLAIITMADALSPLIASLILAYLMQGMVTRLSMVGLTNRWAFTLVYCVFILGYALVFLFLLPLVWRQLSNLLGEMPRWLEGGQQALMTLPNRYPGLISHEQLESLLNQVTAQLATMGQGIVSTSLSSITNVFALLLYMILVPILVFFLLKDKDELLKGVTALFGGERPLLRQVWDEMNDQLSNYVRGKAIEIFVVSVISIIAFQFLGLKYAVLIGVLVGLSVIIPYVGATVVTVPVLMVGYFQWGIGSEFWWLFVVYMVIQALDGNVLVPLLFSEVVNLHPVAIIMAVLVFGSFWGLWGVFFAIPLATLVMAVYRAWPTTDSKPFRSNGISTGDGEKSVEEPISGMGE